MPTIQETDHLVFNPSGNSTLPSFALDNIPRYLFRVVSPFRQEDIFDNFGPQKRHAVAHALNLHLRWWSEDGVEDNFWTLTTSFTPGTFLRDLDLMQAFFDPNDQSWDGLNRFRNLRMGGYYFVEYLTQGSLRIADRHQVVSTASLFQDDLMKRLQPHLPDIQNAAHGEPGWADPLLDPRKQIWPTNPFASLSTEETRRHLRAVAEIGNLSNRA
ncbi:hypothetical protein BJX66DRAFT_331138 [Aspergillus keveii]|uniref:Uncharacterized protein n=1 Tax=Aspergillus keveii TaxID=714993 RepID=A0ABR4FHD9_9EURO